MEYSVKKLPKSELEIDVVIPFAEFEPHVKRAAVLISEDRDFDGFRRGKAPYEVVKNQAGEAVIYERAAELAVRRTFREVLEKIRAGESRDGGEAPAFIGQPSVTVAKLAPGNEFRYKAVIAFLPPFALPDDYRAIAARVVQGRTEVSATEKEVDEALEWVRESRAASVAADRPAAQGDRVEADFELFHKGVRVEDGVSKNHPFILGRRRFLPGFEEAFVGMRQGEEKSFCLSVPEDWPHELWRGKELDVRVFLRRLEERRLPDLNDDFARSVGNFSSLASLRESVREGILREKEEKETQRIRASLIGEIAAKISLEVPNVLIEAEIDKMIQEFREGIESAGMKWEDYLLHLKKNPEEFRADWREQAERRVRLSLTLEEIAKTERIEPGQDEIQKKKTEILAQFRSPEEARNRIDPNDFEEYAKSVVRNQKVFEFLEGRR
jgi:trigger factor